jgi:8-oxo-dGTP pyrophosphatase MutT (NUDIX family)
MKSKNIRSVSWLHFVNNKVLCARTKGKDKFYIPGGKIDATESLEEALHREVHEELNVQLVDGSLSLAIIINAPAHGFSDNRNVEMHCFLAKYKQTQKLKK